VDSYIRINKYIASCGALARRKVDEYIMQGRITINGITVREPGFKVNPEKDSVSIDGEPIKIEKNKIYVVLNKPSKVISAVTDDKKRKTVIDIVKVKERIFPIGRLDYDTTGLIILTNDGELANKLMHPKYEVEKTYLVHLSKPLNEKHRKILMDGVYIDRKKTEPAKIRFVNRNDYKRLHLSIHEGRNRQVKKMFEAFGYKIRKLRRTKYGNLKLGSLSEGEWRKLSEKEIALLKI
jgi:pseudouridine synthase